LSHGFSDGDPERGEAIQDGHTNLELGDLTVEVPRGQALAQEFDAVHFGLCAASAVIAAPSSPDGAAEAARYTEGFVSCDRPGAIGLPGFAVLSGRYDRRSAAGGDGVVALAGVEGTGCAP
jgi:hypothetical protein